MWQGGKGQRGPGAEIDGPLCPPLRPRPGALCAGAAETCWVLFPFLGAQEERRGVRGPLIRAGRAGQPECRGIIATCSAISLGCRGRRRPRPPSPAGPAAVSHPSSPVPGRPSRRRGALGAVPILPPRPCLCRTGTAESRRRDRSRTRGGLDTRGALSGPPRVAAETGGAESPLAPSCVSPWPQHYSFRRCLQRDLLGAAGMDAAQGLSMPPPSSSDAHRVLPCPPHVCRAMVPPSRAEKQVLSPAMEEAAGYNHLCC